jgi:hypothetical protein
MKFLLINSVGAKKNQRKQAQARIWVLPLVFFFLGIAVTVFWFTSTRPPARSVASTEVAYPVAASDRAHGPATPVPPPPVVDSAALDSVKHSIPNLQSTSLEEGTRILRAAALTEFLQTVEELQARQKKVEQNFSDGQINRSEEQQRTATKQLQELRAEQVEKLKQIAAKSRAEIKTLEQLKGVAR